MSEELKTDEFAELKKRADALKPKYPEVTFRSFLAETPPDTYVYVTDLMVAPSDTRFISCPQISLYCDSDDCQGMRGFKADANLFTSREWKYNFFAYTCRNCGKRTTRYSIASYISEAPKEGAAGRGTFLKVGQVPSFGPHTPAKVITLIGPDRELFLQGRRAENRGMGIGAFAYYRRVVENQKNRIIGEIAKVAKVVGSSEDVNQLFEQAIAETQFSKSIELVKDVIPQTLLIQGQNPLTLLHTALSKGLHDDEMTDSRCLQKAHSIRIILVELTERASQALKDNKEIESALSALMTRK